MPTTPDRRYHRPGILALDPQALGTEIAAAKPPVAPFRLEADGRAAVIDVCGALGEGDPECVSYSDIRARAREAFQSSAAYVVLNIDSPGGTVFSAFDTPAALRAEAKAAGKTLIAFSSARMQSAGYALACAADRIVCSSVAAVGSIGVIVAHVDMTRVDAAMGLRFEIFSSGKRKADGNPHVPLDEAASASIQRSIDDTAAVFFDLVRETRGIEAQALQGASWVGAAAKTAGVVDEVMSWDSLLAQLASVEPGAMVPTDASAQARAEVTNMKSEDPKKQSAARAALAKAADEGDEKAKRALAAYDEGEDKKAESEEPEKKDAKASDEAPAKEPPAKDEAKKAESDEPKDEEKAKASAPAASAAELGLAARVAELEARENARLAAAAASERTTLLASRPDVPSSLLNAIKGEAPAKIKAILDSIPRSGNPLAPPSSLAPQRAPGAPGVPNLTAPRVEDMDPAIARAMGLLPAESVKSTDTVFYCTPSAEAPRGDK
jgi:capsid assembly protease